jgi:hypothetical protein
MFPSTTPSPELQASVQAAATIPYKTTFHLPRNLTLAITHPITVEQAEKLAHVQLLRLWEALIEMRDEPIRSPYIEWHMMNKVSGFNEEDWVEKMLASITVVEEVLRGKWKEPISEKESVKGFLASRGQN